MSNHLSTKVTQHRGWEKIDKFIQCRKIKGLGLKSSTVDPQDRVFSCSRKKKVWETTVCCGQQFRMLGVLSLTPMLREAWICLAMNPGPGQPVVMVTAGVEPRRGLAVPRTVPGSSFLCLRVALIYTWGPPLWASGADKTTCILSPRQKTTSPLQLSVPPPT